jgi:hypothetical protein
VIAPVLVALTMIVAGILVARRYHRGGSIRLDWLDWSMGLTGTACILFSFMRDTAATLGGQMPQGYWYGLFIVGLLLYVATIGRVLGSKPDGPSREK